MLVMSLLMKFMREQKKGETVLSTVRIMPEAKGKLLKKISVSALDY